MAGGGLTERTGLTLGGRACKHGLFTDFVQEVDKLAKEKPALRSGFAEIGAQDGFEKGAAHCG